MCSRLSHSIRDARFPSSSISTMPDQTIRVWDLRSGQQLHELPDQAEVGGETPLVFTHDSRELVTGFGSRLRVWNLASGEQEQDFGSHAAPITALATAAEHPTVVSADADGGIRVWDSASWIVRDEQEIGGGIHGLAVTADGSAVVAATKTQLLRWNVDATRAPERIDAAPGEPYGWQQTPLAFANEARQIVFGPDFRRWDPATDTISSPADPALWRAGLALSPSGSHALCAATIDDYRDVAMSSGDAETLEIWDLAAKTCILDVRSPGASLAASAIDEDGNIVVSTYMDHTVRVWDIGLAALPENPTHDNSIRLIELIGGGSRLVLSVDRGNQVRAWDLDTGDEVEESDETHKHMEPFWSDREREPDPLEAMLAAIPAPTRSRNRWGVLGRARRDDWSWAVAPNRTSAVRYVQQRRKVSETLDPPDAADKRPWIPAQVWDLSAGEPKRRHPHRGHDDRLLGFALTPDGRQAISYGYGSLRQWDLTTGRQMRRLEGHGGPIWCVAISREGAWLVSGSEDSTLRLWSIATGKNVATFTGESPIRACAIEYDASRLMVFGGEDSGRVHLLEAVLS